MAMRRNHDATFKARVALEALKGERMAAELATADGVHPTMIHQRKKALLEEASDIFERGAKKSAEIDEEAVRDLHAKIGELAVAKAMNLAIAPAAQDHRGVKLWRDPMVAVQIRLR